jgi:O-methyltransferase involved in polyketide biosynthesis
MSDSAKAKADLEGVPETLLWNLYQRATEARRPDAVLRDPKAIELVDSIDYPFEDRFGKGGFGQWQSLRALCFDQEINQFLSEHPEGQVVALGEGLETQFWRIDNGRVRWLGVDLPETTGLRERLLPDEAPRRRTLSCSVLDEAWMEHVDPAGDLLLSAQGLLMYFEPERVRELVAACARRFPRAGMVFDGVPPWFSRRTVSGQMKTAQGYRTPPMPWAVDAAEKDRLRSIPGIDELRDLKAPRGRGLLYGLAFPLANRIRPIRELGITGLPIMALRFAAPRP